ncbi:pyridoxamine 5'-phosphate oxidase family protein [bacterium]|nr:pyridoxamine 5'-phosphate oxidase family protein [bacterium]
MMDRRDMLKIAAGAVAWLLWPRAGRGAALPPATEAALRASDLIYVATRRRDGSLSAVAPIWFYYRGDGTLFFTTSPTAWKAKRIAAGSPLYIWVGAEDGPFVQGRAQPTTDAALIDQMGAAYAEKYWIAWAGFFKPRSSRVAEGKTKAYVVTLEAAAPPERTPA